MQKVQFWDGKDGASEKPANATIIGLIDAVRAAGEAITDVAATAVDALAEIFSDVKFAKGKKWDARSASSKLRESPRMADLRGYLYPTDREFTAFLAAVTIRDEKPKGNRKTEQGEVQAIRARMKSRVEYLINVCINAYVADVLGFEYANGKKRTELQRLESIIKSLDVLSKGKDEAVKARAKAMLAADTAAMQAWRKRSKKQAPTPTLDDWTKKTRAKIVKQPGTARLQKMKPAAKPVEIPAEEVKAAQQ